MASFVRLASILAMVGVFVEVREEAEHIGRHVAVALERIGVARCEERTSAAIHFVCAWRACGVAPPETRARRILVALCTQAEYGPALSAGFDDVVPPTEPFLTERLGALFRPGVVKSALRGFLSRSEGKLLDRTVAEDGGIVLKEILLRDVCGVERVVRTRRLTTHLSRLRKKLPPEDAQRLEATPEGLRFRRR